MKELPLAISIAYSISGDTFVKKVRCELNI